MKILTNYASMLLKSVVLTFALVGVVSCQKNKNDDKSIDPVGYWKGHYTQTGFPGEAPLNVLVKADGTARIYDMGIKTDTAALAANSKSSGIWMLSDKTLEVVFTGDGELTLLSGIINPEVQTWTGTWARSAVVKGTISLSK